MGFTAFINSDVFTWVIIPLLIFIARVLDVSIGTIRIIFISRGHRFLAPILGFFEVSIWLLAIKQIFDGATNPVAFVAYAAGFASGTYAGIIIEEKISIGKVVLRVISRTNTQKIIKALKDQKYHVYSMDAKSFDRKKVKILYAVIKRHSLHAVIDIIKHLNPHAFYSIEDVRFAYEEPLVSNHRKKRKRMDSLNQKKGK